MWSRLSVKIQYSLLSTDPLLNEPREGTKTWAEPIGVKYPCTLTPLSSHLRIAERPASALGPVLVSEKDGIDRPDYGQVAEWFKALVLKTRDGENSSVGSNPTLSANLPCDTGDKDRSDKPAPYSPSSGEVPAIASGEGVEKIDRPWRVWQARRRRYRAAKLSRLGGEPSRRRSLCVKSVQGSLADRDLAVSSGSTRGWHVAPDKA